MFSQTGITNAFTGPEIRLEDFKGYAIYAKWTNEAPSAKAFTAVAATDLITSAAHGYKTGLKGQVSSTGVLPAGLSAATDYFIIYVSADTYKLATSLANALAGTAVDITDAGTGVHTFTATALAGATIKLQSSCDGVNWVDVASSTQNITASSEFLYEKVDVYYHRVRAVIAITAGQITVSCRINAKG